MKMIIDKKVYDTETAKLIASYSNGLSYGDLIAYRKNYM